MPEYRVSSNTSNFRILIRHFEFVDFYFKFGFRDPKILQNAWNFNLHKVKSKKKTKCALLRQCHAGYVSIPRSTASMPTKGITLNAGSFNDHRTYGKFYVLFSSTTVNSNINNDIVQAELARENPAYACEWKEEGFTEFLFYKTLLQVCFVLGYICRWIFLVLYRSTIWDWIFIVRLFLDRFPFSIRYVRWFITIFNTRAKFSTKDRPQTGIIKASYFIEIHSFFFFFFNIVQLNLLVVIGRPSWSELKFKSKCWKNVYGRVGYDGVISDDW